MFGGVGAPPMLRCALFRACEVYDVTWVIIMFDFGLPSIYDRER